MNVLATKKWAENAVFVTRMLELKDLMDESGFWETLGELTDTPIISWEKRMELFQDYERQGQKVFVAVNEFGHIVSTVTLLVSSRFFHGGRSVGFIEDVVTREVYRKRGLASALIAMAEQVAQSKGCYKVILNSGSVNVPFYQKRGYILKEKQLRKNL